MRAILTVTLITLSACGHGRACELTPRPVYRLVPDTTPPNSITGVVVALPDSSPVRSAQVMISGGRSYTLTDSLGRFSVTDTTQGAAIVKVQTISYRPVQFQVRKPVDHGIHLTISLVPWCLKMEPIAN